MGSVGIAPGWMNDTINMLWMAVERIKLERFVARVLHIVPRAGGHDHGHIGLDPAHGSIHQNFTFTVFNTKKLVAVIMHFFANFLAGQKRHQDELRVSGRVENTPERTSISSTNPRMKHFLRL
jgi:hypothetical protein